ncbi:MAG: ADP-ribosylglycohydrolase family protein [Defluviitaleaceae bacterium]|nr:ADP-ribosylglycohydrolase family protein [Defluviitaleaceae bacterium]
MKPEHVEKIYAGWLAKIIGIRLGAPIEGWTYQAIKDKYGELHHYPVNFKRFAADDDSNGPLFFLRALEDGEGGFNLTPQAVGEALLNYAPYEHGFFWWGGYGISTEHTAYLNLRAGIPAPQSGSIQQNGHTVAEQIGGQIFIDSWGLVCPGNPDLAAKYARMAASVTHGGNGIYGGIFIATCISYAFEENDIRAIIEKGLSYIPSDCEYTRVVRAVMDYYDNNKKGLPKSSNAVDNRWRDGYRYIFDNFGYDKYPGNCHIIPNIAVMILAMLYGEGDFDNTINICNMCGWDTDCNVGNVATIMGVVCGLEGIDFDKWRKPINDFLACSSVVGSLNIMDIPYGAAYIAKLAGTIAGEALPKGWQQIVDDKHRIDGCHFEFPGSTHAIEVRKDGGLCEAVIVNSDEQASTGSRSLKVHMPMQAVERAYVYKRTYLYPHDFDDSRYDPSFSPLVYPGQTIRGSVFIPVDSKDCTVRLYAKTNDGIVEGEPYNIEENDKGKWMHLSFRIPPMESGLIEEAGFTFKTVDEYLTCFIDDLYFEGQPDYGIDFSQIKEEYWGGLHREISQFTKLKGLSFLEDDMLHLACSDFAEMYTGHHNWADYMAAFTLQPHTGSSHFVNVRVQGAIRSYAAGFCGDKLCLMKNSAAGYKVLTEMDFTWTLGQTYTITVKAQGNKLDVWVNGVKMINHIDDVQPYLTGSIGVSVQSGSRCGYRKVAVQ